jgi:glycosyltransferase involved in cell wall biosynthesis
MKIAMLTSDYLPNIGGIASHIYELSRALITNGHEVEVWFWNMKVPNPDPKQMGSIPVRPLQLPNKGRRLSVELGGAIDLALKQFNAEILHLHTLDSLLPGLRRISADFSGKKIWTNHTSRFLRKVDSFFWRQKIRFQGKILDGLLAPSIELLEKSTFMGFGPHNSLYVPNGVDLDKFTGLDKADARKRLALPEERFILLSTRRFSPKNGLRFLALAMPEVVKTIPNALFVYCGNLPDAKDWTPVREFVTSNRLEEFARFEGAIPNADINLYLSAADVVVLPSLMEATSISGLEAMSAGRPLVGTRVGGIPELIDEGTTGILVEPGSSEALADGIIRAYRELDLAEAGLRSREKVEQAYAWPMIAGRIADFYQRI